MEDRLRHLIHDVAARCRPHQAGDADALATLYQDLGQREGDDQAPLQLALHAELHELHRSGAVGPDPYGVRGLPFLLAHIEEIVPAGTAPVDAARRLPRHEPPILPEILSGAGAPAAM